MNWYVHVLQNYFKFDGRARRAEFWMFTLINFGITVALALVAGLIGTDLLSNLYGLAVFIPSLAVGIRRLHDTGRSGWWYLIALTVIGIFLLIFFWAQDSEPRDNQYGPNPKAGVAFS